MEDRSMEDSKSAKIVRALGTYSLKKYAEEIPAAWLEVESEVIRAMSESTRKANQWLIEL
jgi:hypothetical protein